MNEIVYDVIKKIKILNIKILFGVLTVVILFTALIINLSLINKKQNISKKAAITNNSLFEITAVDPSAAAYGTFQSHNQKVVSNQNGIFMTYLKSDGVKQNLNPSIWRLMRSIDGGKTFSMIYESTNPTNPPVLETDKNNIIYLSHPDLLADDAFLYRFTPADNYQNPTITKIPHGSYGGAGKYAMMIDESRNQLYYFSHNGYLNIIGLDGLVKKTIQLMTSGTYAYFHYPELYLDNKTGDLYSGWTTLKIGEYMYRAIHIMKSKDGGLTWQKLNGTILNSPIIPDDSGPTDRVTLDNEFDVHTYLWSIVVKDGKIHLPYEAQFPGNIIQHYVRYDIATGKKDKDIYPEWKGSELSLMSLDGFCATRNRESNFPIYCISTSYNKITGAVKLAVLASFNNGETWQDYAAYDMGGNSPVGGAYSIGGAREISADGYILGSFTDTTKNPPTVNFFKVKTELPVTPIPSPTITLTPTPSPTITLTPTPSPTLTPTPTLFLDPTVTPTLTPFPRPTLTPTQTPSPSPKVTLTPTPTPTITNKNTTKTILIPIKEKSTLQPLPSPTKSIGLIVSPTKSLVKIESNTQNSIQIQPPTPPYNTDQKSIVKKEKKAGFFDSIIQFVNGLICKIRQNCK